MSKVSATIGLLFLSACLCVAAPKSAPKALPLKVEGDVVQLVRSFPVVLKAPEGADFYIWNYGDTLKASSFDNALTVTSAPKGTHKISAVSVTINFTVDKDGKVKKEIVKDRYEQELNVGQVPTPDPGPGPGPTPTPTPPDPKPVGDPRVLVVWESSAKENITGILNSTTVRAWTKTNTKGYRAWDKDIILDSDEEEVWRQLWTDVKPQIKELPSLVLVNGQKAVIYPLPKTEKELMDQLEKWKTSFSARNKQKGGDR